MSKAKVEKEDSGVEVSKLNIGDSFVYQGREFTFQGLSSEGNAQVVLMESVKIGVMRMEISGKTKVEVID